MLHRLAGHSDMTVDVAKDLLSHLVRSEDFRACSLALGLILGRPWWYRIWAIQKIDVVFVPFSKLYLLVGIILDMYAKRFSVSFTH